jgi:hypothetical protein
VLTAGQLDHSNEWWRPDALLPALVVVGPYFFNKLIYIFFPSYLVFVATDYACRTFSLAFLYLLLRSEPTSLPTPWRLATPSINELLAQFQRRRHDIYPIPERS